MAFKKSATRGIFKPSFSLLPSHLAQNRADLEIYWAEQWKRMNALGDSLGIPDDNTRWYALALHLAQRHVPELKDAKPIGAPKKWGDYELGVLAVEIEREQERQGGVTIECAASALASRMPWSSFLQVKGGTYMGPDATAALVRQYANARRIKFTKVCRMAFKYHDATGSIEEWENEVLAIDQQRRK